MKLGIISTSLWTVLIIMLNGCGGGGGVNGDEDDQEQPTLSITEDYQVESLGMDSNISTTISINTETPKSLYLLLSNYSSRSDIPTIKHNAKVFNPTLNKDISKSNISNIKKPLILHAPQYVQDFRDTLQARLQRTSNNHQPQTKIVDITQKNKDITGQTSTFFLDLTETESTTATARKVVSSISTDFGTKTLNIWVSDDSFGACAKRRCVTQTMVDQLADIFLKPGLNNDIYDWVTHVYGEEWGNDHDLHDILIPKNDEITILLTDIDDDNEPNGGVIGFFFAKDNFLQSKISGSNERIMFYIDSVMFANPDGETWEFYDFWPKEIVSTLAHEFQHMINVYQKSILLDSNVDIWINEMLSEATEDLIATKIQHIGPRGVDYTDGSAGDPGNIRGRYPLFNVNNTRSLTTWYGDLPDYSKVNAFGAYLLRNYGGAKLLHDIMHNKHEDEQAVVTAVNAAENGSKKTFNDLLKEWGIAVILSDNENLIDLPFYNTGDFLPNIYNGITYDLGSINFFNYNPLPTIYTTTGTVSPQGNYYYKIGDDLTGNITIDLELNGQTEVTLIAK